MQVYNYLLESYPMKREVMYPAHKRSELRKVYNEIINLTKRSPLFKIDLSKENQEYTIGIKETSLYLKAKLEKMGYPEESGFASRTLKVSNERVITAKLMDEDTEGLPDSIAIKVERLARLQINYGKELMDASRGLPTGIYHLTAKVMDQFHPLTFIHEERTENRDTVAKMAEFLNTVPGINASVEKSSSDYSNLVIASEQAGKNGENAFAFFDSDRVNHIGIVDYFGLDRIAQYSETAQFTVNGEQKNTSTNTFYIDKKIHVRLNDVSDQTVTIKVVPDSDKILTSVDSILQTYNHLIRIATNRTSDYAEHYRATKLISEMKNLENAYEDELNTCGIKADEKGFLSMDETLAAQAVWDGGMESLFTGENGFIARLINKSESIAINPLDYLDKTVITYPNNEEETFRNPYITSFYSGLFFSSYC